MPTKITVIQVGAPDPEARNSPIVDEDEELFSSASGEYGEAQSCYFNARAYPHCITHKQSPSSLTTLR